MAVVSLISWKLSLSTLLNSINTTVYTCRQKSAQTFENLRNDINKAFEYMYIPGKAILIVLSSPWDNQLSKHNDPKSSAT